MWSHNITCFYGNDRLVKCVPRAGEAQLRTSANNYDRFPDLEFEIEGHEFEIYPWDYVLLRNGYAEFKIVTDSRVNHWQLGMPFFERYYTVLDFEANKMGFVEVIDDNSGFSGWVSRNMLTFCLIVVFCSLAGVVGIGYFVKKHWCS